MRGLNTKWNEEALKIIQSEKTSLIKSAKMDRDIVVIMVEPDKLIELMTFFRHDPRFDFSMLVDLTAVDYLGIKEPRFEVVYMLFNHLTNQRLRVKTAVAEGHKVPSLISVWKSANWPEREVYDLMGIEFDGHPLMERLIMPDGYIGHPLRKDFPIKGIGEDYLIESILLPVQKQAEQAKKRQE